jgi:hypothetical protein
MTIRFMPIFIAMFLTLIFNQGYSQEKEIFEDCKVISIDTTSVLPNYFVIKIDSKKGKLILLSLINKEESTQSWIQVDSQYDFELELIDSVLIEGTDSTYYFEFTNFRGGRGTSTLYFDGNKTLMFEDFNFKPFRPLNLNGLEYIKTEKL